MLRSWLSEVRVACGVELATWVTSDGGAAEDGVRDGVSRLSAVGEAITLNGAAHGRTHEGGRARGPPRVEVRSKRLSAVVDSCTWRGDEASGACERRKGGVRQCSWSEGPGGDF